MQQSDIIHGLLQAQRAHPRGLRKCMDDNFLSYSGVKKFIAICREILFPGYYGAPLYKNQCVKDYLTLRMDEMMQTLSALTLAAFCFDCGEESDAQCKAKSTSAKIANTFAENLPAINRILLTDVDAIARIDPAASSREEIIFAYPGIRAIISHRIAHQLWTQNVPLLPRMISEMAHRNTGIDIHPAAPIGESFAIDHGTGTVIGSTSIIGNNVSIYQGVTLGAKTFAFDDNGNALDIPRHPIIEDNVTIYAGAKIMGRITIGSGSVIGGNVWLTDSVPPNSRILRKM